MNFPSLLAFIDKTNYVYLLLVSIRFCRSIQSDRRIFKLCLEVCRNQGSIVQLYPLFCLHFSQNISKIRVKIYLFSLTQVNIPLKTELYPQKNRPGLSKQIFNIADTVVRGIEDITGRKEFVFMEISVDIFKLYY